MQRQLHNYGMSGKIKLSKTRLMQKISNRAIKSRTLRNRFSLDPPSASDCNDYLASCCNCCCNYSPCCLWHCCQNLLGFQMTLTRVAAVSPLDCADCLPINGLSTFVPINSNCSTANPVDPLDCESCECGAVVAEDGYKGGIDSGSWLCSGIKTTIAFECGNPLRTGAFRWNVECAIGRLVDGVFVLFPPETTPWTRVLYGWGALGPLGPPGEFAVDSFNAITYFPGPQPACPTSFDSDFPETTTTYANTVCDMSGVLITMSAVYA